MSSSLILAAQLCALLAVPLLAGRSTARRVICGIAVAIALILPWFLPYGPIPRAVLSYTAWQCMIKGTQLCALPQPWPWHRRLWHALLPHDLRKARRIAPAFDWALFSHVMLYGLAMAVGLAAAMNPPRLHPLRLLVGLMGGSLFVYSAMEVFSELVRFFHRLAGVQLQAVQRIPLAARTLGEFWGERWNRPVGEWLNQTAFRPLARRGHALTGVFAAFLLSAMVHAYFIGTACGVRHGAMMGTFFVVHGILVVLERPLSVRRWPAVAAHTWTVALLTITSPLFVYPLLHCMGFR